MKPTVKLHGVEDVYQMLNRVAPREATNLLRTTVHDMAKQVRDDAKSEMPEDEGTMKAVTKHKRERAEYGRVRSTVRVGLDAFYWRFLERGDGPDRIAHDFFRKAVLKMKSEMDSQFLKSFARKFEAALARKRK